MQESRSWLGEREERPETRDQRRRSGTPHAPAKKNPFGSRKSQIAIRQSQPAPGVDFPNWHFLHPLSSCQFFLTHTLGLSLHLNSIFTFTFTFTSILLSPQLPLPVPLPRQGQSFPVSSHLSSLPPATHVLPIFACFCYITPVPYT